MDERRRFERTTSSVKVEMMHPAFGKLVGFARDISDGGAQVIMDQGPLPPVGTIANVVFKRMVGAINAEPVAMRVVYLQGNLVGLSFAMA